MASTATSQQNTSAPETSKIISLSWAIATLRITKLALLTGDSTAIILETIHGAILIWILGISATQILIFKICASQSIEATITRWMDKTQ